MAVVSAAASGRFRWLLSDPCLNELLQVFLDHVRLFRSRLPNDPARSARFLFAFMDALEILLEALSKRTPVEITVKGRGPYIIDDPSDDKFIICAIDGDADFIVTMDGTHIMNYFYSRSEPVRNSAGGEIRALSPFQFVNFPLRGKAPRV